MEKVVNKLEKFKDPYLTAKGETRAWVDPVELETLWVNTGTLCNLACENCYIESSPQNDRLVYISLQEVNEYLDEIKNLEFNTKEIAFTGGEPFMNPDMIKIMESCLSKGFEVLVLTNAMLPMMKKKDDLLELNQKYRQRLRIRVSLDHYSEELHAKERGAKAWGPAIKGLNWLSENNFQISVAGRTVWGESESSMTKGYKNLFKECHIQINTEDPQQLVLFPEMDESAEVPEITTKCWDILNIKPEQIMCTRSRMIVKRKGAAKPAVVACTLLPYDEQFELGQSLKDGFSRVQLNHPHCAKFCVLGGGSCSQ